MWQQSWLYWYTSPQTSWIDVVFIIFNWGITAVLIAESLWYLLLNRCGIYCWIAVVFIAESLWFLFLNLWVFTFESLWYLLLNHRGIYCLIGVVFIVKSLWCVLQNPCGIYYALYDNPFRYINIWVLKFLCFEDPLLYMHNRILIIYFEFLIFSIQTHAYS